MKKELTRRKFIKQTSATLIGAGLISYTMFDTSCSNDEKHTPENNNKQKINVIALIGSSRLGGNTDMLVDKIIKEINSHNLSAEKIYLKDKQILPCKLCDHCRSKGRPDCIQNDDFNEIVKKIQQAEAVILSSPVYWRNKSGAMNLFTERCYSQFDKDWKNSKISGKQAVLVIVSGDKNTEEECTPLINSFTRFLEWNKINISGKVTASAIEKAEILNNPEALLNAKKEGEKLAKLIK